jgi:hypothetical protein
LAKMKNAPAVPSAGDALIHWRGAVQIPPPNATGWATYDFTSR